MWQHIFPYLSLIHISYLAKHPDDKDSTQNELQEEQEKLISEIAELKVPLTEVQEDLKKLQMCIRDRPRITNDISYISFLSLHKT